MIYIADRLLTWLDVERLLKHKPVTYLPADVPEQTGPFLNLLTKELRESEGYERALRMLGGEYPAEDALMPGVDWLEAEFLRTLMSISTVREALDALPSSLLFASASEWARALYAAPAQALQEVLTVS